MTTSPHMTRRTVVVVGRIEVHIDGMGDVYRLIGISASSGFSP